MTIQFDTDSVRIAVENATRIPPGNPANFPQHAIAFDLTAPFGGAFELEVVGVETADQATNGQSFFDDLVDRCRKRGRKFKDDAYLQEPYKTSLSMTIPRQLIYVLFRISVRKLQFDRTSRPISVPSNWINRFSLAKIVDRRGMRYSHQANVYNDECQLCYFVVDGTQFTAQEWRDGVPINFHVDLESVKKENGVKSVSYIPIVIDPDIRHPGGSGP